MIWKLIVPGAIEDVDELRLLEWHGAVGRMFSPGDLIVELETHKAVVEIRAGRQAVLRRMVAEPGSWHKPGDTLALLSSGEAEALPSEAGAEEALPVEFEIT
jgi:pyruvate/2-oxoglutarate dehydrogenase complex dihydrolipoamide acyltransferase (E2) component